MPGAEPSARGVCFQKCTLLRCRFPTPTRGASGLDSLSECASLKPCVYGAFESELLHFRPHARICQRSYFQNAKNRQNSTGQRHTAEAFFWEETYVFRSPESTFSLSAPFPPGQTDGLVYSFQRDTTKNALFFPLFAILTKCKLSARLRRREAYASRHSMCQ